MNAALLLGLLLAAAPRTIHVSAAGPSDGDGTPQKPFRTLDRALSQQHEGDVIRLAAGTYNVGALVITARSVRVEGGYDAAFEKRDPFGTPSVVQPAVVADRAVIEVDRGSVGTVIDGLWVDGSNGNYYGRMGLPDGQWPRNAPLIRIKRGRDITVRNCTLINGISHAVSASIATRVSVTNNVMLNNRISALTAWGVQQGAQLIATNNTILGVWAERPGGARGNGVDVQQFVAAQLDRNIIAQVQGACMRVGRGMDSVGMRENVLGTCAQGALLNFPGAGPAAATPLAGLDGNAAVEASGNRGLSTPLALDALAAPLEELTRPAPDAGPRLHAPKIVATGVRLVGLEPNAGAQPIP